MLTSVPKSVAAEGELLPALRAFRLRCVYRTKVYEKPARALAATGQSEQATLLE